MVYKVACLLLFGFLRLRVLSLEMTLACWAAAASYERRDGLLFLLGQGAQRQHRDSFVVEQRDQYHWEKPSQNISRDVFRQFIALLLQHSSTLKRRKEKAT
eukprot:1157796-Pelagomonas_calceolata.AAC.1